MWNSYGQHCIRRYSIPSAALGPIHQWVREELSTWNDYTIVGAPAPVKKNVIPNPPGVPPPPEYLPEMKDEAIVKNTIQALSPRIVAVHGPTGTGKSTAFPLAITHLD